MSSVSIIVNNQFTSAEEWKKMAENKWCVPPAPFWACISSGVRFLPMQFCLHAITALPSSCSLTLVTYCAMLVLIFFILIWIIYFIMPIPTSLVRTKHSSNKNIVSLTFVTVMVLAIPFLVKAWQALNKSGLTSK